MAKSLWQAALNILQKNLAPRDGSGQTLRGVAEKLLQEALRVFLSNLACMWGVVAGVRSRVKKTEVIQPVIVNRKNAVFH
jgi:hypothetical protein